MIMRESPNRAVVGGAGGAGTVSDAAAATTNAAVGDVRSGI